MIGGGRPACGAGQTMVTEKEAVLRERMAFRKAVDEMYASPCWPCSILAQDEANKIAKRVSRLYPLPLKYVTRPRVAHSPNGYSYRVVGGRIEICMGPTDGWQDSCYQNSAVRIGAVRQEAADIRIILDLLENPTETVEVEDTEE